MTQLVPEVHLTLTAVFIALSLASVVSVVLQWRSTHRDHLQLWTRIRTWWAIVGLFSACLLWSPVAVTIFLGFASFLALKEFLSMTPTRRADRRVLFYAYLSVIVQYYLAATNREGMFMVFIPVLMFVWLPTRMWMIGHTQGFMQAIGTLYWAVMLTVFSLSHTALLLSLRVGESPRFAPHVSSVFDASEMQRWLPGPGLLVFLILLTECNDIFQILWGKSLGVRKLAPTVSPRKTYAGMIGGVCTTVLLASIVGPWLTLMDLHRAVLAGIIIAFAGLAGDLCISALKRDLKIKDFGATLPGHGGVLDRVDSLVFTAPLFFHFIRYCYG